MEILYRSLSELKPYKRNPRNNAGAVTPVAESIKNFGFRVPLIIDRGGVIIAGHTRYKAAELLNIDKVPCLIADDLTPEQVKAFRLADNKVAEFAEWDFALLADELQDLTAFDVDMSLFGFVEPDNIEWAGVEDLTPEKYKEPEQTRLKCPHCQHTDIKAHFAKV